MKAIDISVPISERTVSWRDEFPVETTWHSRIDVGDRTTNSSWWLHAHTGTHLDAPLHHLRDGESTDAIDPSDHIGPCRVVDLEDAPGQIGADDLVAARPKTGERLLLRTGNSRRGLLRRPGFTADYIGVTADGAARLVEAGVRLLGVDFLSVEPPGARVAETHRVLLSAGVTVLEGLVLTGVPAGAYTLLFLPLRLCGAEAAPGRALLLPDGIPIPSA